MESNLYSDFLKKKKEKKMFRFFRAQRSLNGPKMKFFKFYEKFMRELVLIFCMNGQTYFMVKNLILRPSGQMGPKWAFSSFVMFRAFLIFCNKLRWHEDLKFIEMNFFFFFFFLRFLGQKEPDIGQKWEIFNQKLMNGMKLY